MLPGVQDTSGRLAGHVPSYSRNVVASRGSDACLTCWPWSVVAFTSDPRQRKTTNTEKSKQRLFMNFHLNGYLDKAKGRSTTYKRSDLKKQTFKQPSLSTFRHMMLYLRMYYFWSSSYNFLPTRYYFGMKFLRSFTTGSTEEYYSHSTFHKL